MEEKIRELKDRITDIQLIYLDIFEKYYETVGVKENIKELDAKTTKLDDRIFQLQELYYGLRKQVRGKTRADWILSGSVIFSCVISVIFWFLR